MIYFYRPKPKHIEVMGDKIKARETISKTGIPLVPGQMVALLTK